MVFLRTVALVIAGFAILIGGGGLWMLGLVKPADWLFDRERANLAVLWILGYFILTTATVAGVVATVSCCCPAVVCFVASLPPWRPCRFSAGWRRWREPWNRKRRWK